MDQGRRHGVERPHIARERERRYPAKFGGRMYWFVLAAYAAVLASLARDVHRFCR